MVGSGIQISTAAFVGLPGAVECALNLDRYYSFRNTACHSLHLTRLHRLLFDPINGPALWILQASLAKG